MAITIDGTIGSGIPAYGANKISVLEGMVNFAVINSGAGAGQNDVVQALNVPANCLVLGVHAVVETADVSTNLADLDIGDGSDVDGYHDGLDATAAVNAYGTPFALAEAAPNTPVGYVGGKFYAAADTIDLKVITAATITTGKVKLSAVVVNLNRSTD